MAGARQWLIPPLLLLLLLFVSASSSLPPTRKIPKLGVSFHREADDASNNNDLASKGFYTYYYNQTLDHFNYHKASYTTFQQKYVMNYEHWRGANASAPIFAYLGEESALDNDVQSIGFLPENAAQFGALLVYIEHRFYGESIPFGSRNESMRNETIRGYFCSAQALADYAEVLLHIKKSLSAESSPVIVFGGSYGGMLATWFRLKYPHVALGALASSAPILYFDDITPSNGYYSIVTKDFKEAGEFCSNTISKSWAEIDRIAAEPNGLSTLDKKFKTCSPLKGAEYMKSYLESLLSVAAQYDRPPKYPVNIICDGIIAAANKSDDIIDLIVAGVSAYFGDRSCYDFEGFFPTDTLAGWDWQVCSEILMPIGRGENETMFPAAPFRIEDYNDYCGQKYGVIPRPHWVTTYYGGQHIKEVLKRFGSNIIFSNGLRDPYSSGGVLEDISETIVAMKTAKGSHCLDLLPKREDDPEWLVLQRSREVEVMSGWLLAYYQDLREAKDYY